MEQEYQEVDFNQYCKTCKFEKLKESAEPCDDCLSNPTNLYSAKPVHWKEKP